jgi:hypothetical protein
VNALTLEDWRNIATVVAAIIALVVYITNSIAQRRQREIDNAMRFSDAHRRLTNTEFILKNVREMEHGQFNRASWDEAMELDFNRFLGELEDYALLTRSGAVSQTASIYMFGWFAQKIQPILTKQERDNVYWELAVQFLDELKYAADDFYKKPKAERDTYHRKRHFGH